MENLRSADIERVGERHQPLLVAGALVLAILLIVWAAVGLRRLDATDVTTQVIITICNDGLVGPGEVCDNGAGNNLGLYASSTADRTCAPDCFSFGPYCGDGVLQVRFGEQCDDGNNVSGDLCTPLCQAVPSSAPQGAPTVGATPFIPNAAPGGIGADKETRVVLRGKAFPGSLVSVLLDGRELGTATADTNADFLYSTNVVPPGTATFGFSARDTRGVTSITTSVVFEVVQSAITTVANVFLPPTLSVTPVRVEPGEPLTVSGYTVPHADVSVDIRPGAGTSLTAKADAAGAWTIQIDSASLGRGAYSAKASFQLSSLVKSGFGKAVSFSIGTDARAGRSPDLNRDRKVNLVDFSIFLLSWNTADEEPDFNEDGRVNLADFSIMLFAWTG